MCGCGCTGNTQAVLVHQLSKHVTQNPFRKNRGRVVRVLFHPLKPFLFVATQNHVRVYNLAQQALAKKLIGGSGSITSMAIHPGGDHVIVGSEVCSCLCTPTKCAVSGANLKHATGQTTATVLLGYCIAEV